MIRILMFIAISLIFNVNSAFADTQNAHARYDDYQYIFKPGDELTFLKNADMNLELYFAEKIKSEKDFYLQESMRYYFLLSKIIPHSIDAQIGLGRVYNQLNLDRLAQNHFSKAININSEDPKANLYFANFYYKKNDLISAVYYYNKSYICGYSMNPYLNYQLAVVYDKLGNIELAKKFYENTLYLASSNRDLLNKIRSSEVLNYPDIQ